MKNNLTPAERLIVAADFKPRNGMSNDIVWLTKELFDIAEKLKGTGVYIKLNSILRLLGYSVISLLHDLDLKVFVDLKLNDISETMKIDAMLLKPYKPDILTVMCSSGVAGMEAVKGVLPETEILGVTFLTSLNNEDCMNIYNTNVGSAVLRLASQGYDAGIDGFIASPKEVKMLKMLSKNIAKGAEMTINTPGIRPIWSIIPGDDQSRTMTPRDAIMAGADRIVVGRPITTAKDPMEALRLTIEEIEKACENK